MTDIRISATNSLQAIDNWLKIISGNLTGSNVNGYRQVRAEFADVLVSHIRDATPSTGSVGSINPLQYNAGGTTLKATTTDFTQGAVQTTNRATDLAVQGDGFFMLSKTPTPTSFDDLVFTRNGSFHFDFYSDENVYTKISGGAPYDPNTVASGYYRLVNQDGLFVMGVRSGTQTVSNQKEPNFVAERDPVPSASTTPAAIFDAQLKQWGIDPTNPTKDPAIPYNPEGLSAIRVPYCKDQTNNFTLNGEFDANLNFDSFGLLRNGDSFVQDIVIDPTTGALADLVKSVALAKFTSPDGLTKKSGSTEFTYNNVAGGMFVGIPGTGQGTIGAYNTIVPSSLETSNSSVNTALPELTIAQKSFTANVKIISVGNSLIDDVNNLIR